MRANTYMAHIALNTLHILTCLILLTTLAGRHREVKPCNPKVAEPEFKPKAPDSRVYAFTDGPGSSVLSTLCMSPNFNHSHFIFISLYDCLNLYFFIGLLLLFLLYITHAISNFTHEILGLIGKHRSLTLDHIKVHTHT